LTNLYVAIHNLNSDIVFDVYLTDDGSSDGTWDAVMTNFPSVNLIKGDGNLYWCRGMIKAWKYAIEKDNYDGFLWLNNDSYLYGNALNIMFDSIDEAGDYSIISGAFISESTQQTSYGGKIKDELLIPNGQLQKFTQLNGNFVFISKKVFEKIGLLDRIFHHSLGDYDYGYRAIKADITLYLTPCHVGICDRNNQISIPYNKQYSITKRFNFLYSPLGPSPFSTFKFNVRHHSIFRALLSFLSVNFMCLFPIIFNIRFTKK
jgi:GT2 family glycosyltransferase